MNTPCQNIIQSAVRARALALVRRYYDSNKPFTADEQVWLRQQCPEAVTGSALERALRLAGLEQAAGRLIHEFYSPDDPSTVRLIVTAALASIPSTHPSEDIE